MIKRNYLVPRAAAVESRTCECMGFLNMIFNSFYLPTALVIYVAYGTPVFQLM